jgi:calcineurin-like phosphoesterase family protein
MGNRWIISDTHFNHTNILKFESRPFPNVEEMNYQMAGRWNRVVKNNDKVYFLGDFGFFADKAKMTELVNSLNGHKYLIMGNHDEHKSSQWWRDVGFKEAYQHPIIIEGFIILSHQPVYLNERMPYVNLHGHIHSRTMEGANYYNVGVELNNYTPIDLNTLIHKFIKICEGKK